jgi:hypothetical protein
VGGGGGAVVDPQAIRQNLFTMITLINSFRTHPQVPFENNPQAQQTCVTVVQRMNEIKQMVLNPVCIFLKNF